MLWRIMIKNKRIHVISWSGKWRVGKEDKSRASKILKEKEDAIEYAKQLGIKDGYEVFVHNKDGSVGEVVK